MFSPGELAAMTATLAETLGSAAGLGDEIVIGRGTATLQPQSVRIVRPGGVGRNVVATDGTSSAQSAVEVVGLPTLDIRPRDRFVDDGLNYEVISVHPQRQIGTVAQARLVQ
jgi:hypothetical protein